MNKCIFPWSNLSIEKNIYYCCCRTSFDAIVYNHIWDKSDSNFLSKIWNSEIYQQMRKIMYEVGIEDACKINCENSKCKTYQDPNKKNIADLTYDQLWNVYKIYENYNNGIYEIDNYPTELEMHLDFFCNSRCVMCFQKNDRSKNNFRELDFDIFKDNLKEFLHYAQYLLLMGGEPTVSPNYNKILNITRSANGALIKLSTNGSLIESHVVPNLDIIDYLCLSGDAATSETYEKIRRGLNWNNFIYQINIFNKNRKNKHMIVNNVIMTLNYHEMKDMAKIYSDLGANLIIFDQAVMHINNKLIAFDINKLRQYIDDVIEISKSYPDVKFLFTFPIINLYKEI